ncbi:putative 3-oxoacyl-reductase [Hyaloraphidium curvatum]|nr:putative 3-oxoacyl-reductase [Hyaloraphidium curvatum]
MSEPPVRASAPARRRLSTRSYSIEGRVALVTGGASGIGRSTCHVLSDHGCKIAVVDLGSNVDEVVAEINECHGEGTAKGFRCDVRDMEAVQKTTDAVAEAFGAIDFLINCAGVTGGPGPNTLMAPDPAVVSKNVADVVDVNLVGTVRFMATCAPYLAKSASVRPDGVGPPADGTSRIVNIASVAGLFTTGSYGYDASKHAVLGVTKAACAELGPLGITVNAICPGLILTPMTSQIQDLFHVMGADTPAKRAGTAEDIAQVIYWLCTPASGFINGEGIVVDGGWTKILPAGWPYRGVNGSWEDRFSALLAAKATEK